MEELQERLKELSLEPEEFMAGLPAPVAARVSELKKLQDQHDDLEEQYKKELAVLQQKYQGLYEPLYKERASIVSGEKAVEGAAAADIKGVPKFWCTVLMRCDLTRDIMNEKDPAVLEYLTDIQAETLRDVPNPEEGEPPLTGFKLKFLFAENPYFTNPVLEKTYYMLDDEDPVLEKADGTAIDWKPGKNVTVKVMKKKPKKGAKPDAKPVTKTENVDSFFNFFSPPQIPGDGAAEELDEEEMEQLQEEIEQDYEMGDIIRSRLIPHAVQWFTGEALDDMFDELLADELEDEDEDDEEGEGGGKVARPRQRAGAAAAGEQPECKQQ